MLVCEGEKAAEAASKLFSDLMATTPPHGARSPHRADWTPLKRRRVLVWPDADSPGRDFGDSVARLALEAGAASVAIVSAPEGFPDGWDLADRLPDGWTIEKLRELLDGAEHVAPPRSFGSFRLDARGVWHPGENGEPVLVCGPLEVVALSRDCTSRRWGLLVRWRNLDSEEREEVLPRRLVFEGPADVAAWFADRGLVLGPARRAHSLLAAYLQGADRVGPRVRSVPRVGWHDTKSGPLVFVLPDTALGATDAEHFRLDVGEDFEHAFRMAGTLQDWTKHIGARCVGNSRLVLAVSSAFAAPLLNIADAESGGLHLYGPSSVGKSTALAVAGSVWGGGGTRGYARTWRATDNGLEGVAAAHSDALLCLDEISEADARTAGATAYMLANGQGKSRAGRRGEARAPASWHVLFLSTGEASLGDKVREDGHKRPTAGQEVRVLDVPADAGKGLGLFEDLHGAESAKDFADTLKADASRFYGTAARAFLAHVVADANIARALVATWSRRFQSEHAPKNADSQVRRALSRFGLVAAAGELACRLNVLPRPEGEAMHAAGECFLGWLDARGGSEPAEMREGIRAIRLFVELHGASRFESWDGEFASARERIVNRAGFRRRDDAGRWEYAILPEVWRSEVCVGFNASALARAACERGLLTPDCDGKPQRREHLPGLGRLRVYVVRGGALGDDAIEATESRSEVR